MTTQIKFTTAEEAVKVIKSGDHVHLSSVASAPQCLINAMCARGEAGELKDVHIHHLHTEGPAPYADEKFEGVFQLDSFFVGGNVRKVTQSGYADYIPIFLSETQRLYRCGAVPCNVAMIQVSTPDKHGFVSLGTSVDATLAAVETADYVLAVVNKHVPRAFGQAMIHSSKIDYFVQDDTPLMEAHFSEPNETETAIGKHCAALIEDGATLQMGIGAIPNAVLAQLGGHKNLGIHTEMFADGVLPLVESGVINGEAKNIDKGKMVSTFLMGSQRVYDFIDDNPAVLMMDVGYTNDPYIISKNDRVTAINSALQVDITGQVCADSLGTKFYSGVGGQIDFVYGASLSKGDVYKRQHEGFAHLFDRQGAAQREHRRGQLHCQPVADDPARAESRQDFEHHHRRGEDDRLGLPQTRSGVAGHRQGRSEHPSLEDADGLRHRRIPRSGGRGRRPHRIRRRDRRLDHRRPEERRL